MVVSGRNNRHGIMARVQTVLLAMGKDRGKTLRTLSANRRPAIQENALPRL
jgi:hypothetical protein